MSRFPEAADHSARDGSDANDPIRLLTVGRAVAKKGIDTLLDALALLPEELQWRWTHIGGGPLRETLRAQASQLGLIDRCEFLGGRPQEEVIAAYVDGDLFVLPCRIDRTGDRDGLPNVMVESLALALPVISTPMSGIVELVHDGENGLLVPSDDPRRLADAIAKLTRAPRQRQAYGKAGSATARKKFDHRAQIGALIAKLRNSLTKVRMPN